MSRGIRGGQHRRGIRSFVQFLSFAACVTIACPTTKSDEALPVVALANRVDAVTNAPYQKALREGLQELGYVDGKNIKFLVRYANGDRAKLKQIVSELVASKVDVLVGDAAALREVTSTIPIVSPTMSDPVKTGLVQSLAHPGGNLTGVAAQSFDIVPKQLQLAKELIPGLTHLCILYDKYGDPEIQSYANREFRRLAREAGVTICILPIATLDDIKATRRIIEKERPQALQIWATALTIQHRQAIMDAIGHSVPVFSEGREFADSGALFTYSVDFLRLFKRSAVYIDKILKGAKPGDLPIEQPTEFTSY